MRPLRLAASLVLLAVQGACREAAPASARTSEPVVVAAEQPGPSAITSDAEFVYWNHAGRRLIRKAPRSGGAVVTLFDGGGELGGHSIAVHAEWVYFDRGFECAWPRPVSMLGTVEGGGERIARTLTTMHLLRQSKKPADRRRPDFAG